MQQTLTPERMMAIGSLASLTAGLIAGIGARIIMRIVALTSHMPPSFSIAGTLNIVFTGLFIGFMTGFIITVITVILSAYPKPKKHFPGPIWRGLFWGVLILLVIGLPILLSPSSPNDDINFGIPLLNRCMFASLIIVYGLALGVSEKIYDHYIPRKPTPNSTNIATPAPGKE